MTTTRLPRKILRLFVQSESARIGLTPILGHNLELNSSRLRILSLFLIFIFYLRVSCCVTFSHHSSEHIMSSDGVNENDIALCCAMCCINCGTYEAVDCIGCSGKFGCCCLQADVCCKPNAPSLFCYCCGPTVDCSDCGSVVDVQFQMCNLVVTGALPCNKEVPIAISILGLTLYPKVGCCVKIGDLKATDETYVSETVPAVEGYGSF